MVISTLIGKIRGITQIVQNSVFFPFIISFLFICFLMIFQLGNRPFSTPDEGRYVEIPREMVESGDYLTPRLNGIKYFEKPPLLYWLQSFAMKIGGQSETNMRLTIVLFALLGIIGVFFASRRFMDNQSNNFNGPNTQSPIAFKAALIVGCCPLYFALSRLIILDLPVSVLSILSLFSFVFGIYTNPGLKRRLYIYGFALLSALGILTKGLMVMAIVGPALVIWLTITRNWSMIFPLYFPTALLIFLSIVLPWHIMVGLKNPEFFHKYFIVEHFVRFLTSYHGRYQPFWFFIPVLFLGFYPWSLLLPNAIKSTWSHGNSLHKLWIIQGVWVFLFFSVCNSKLIPYILPSFLVFSMIIGWFINTHPEMEKNNRQLLSISNFILGAMGIMAVLLWPHFLPHKNYLVPYVSLFAALFTLMGWISRRTPFFITGILQNIIMAILLIEASPLIQKPSIKPFIPILHTHRLMGEEVINYHSYYQDLPVYLNETVSIASFHGELQFGTEVEDHHHRIMDEDLFKMKWHMQNRLWVFVPRQEFNYFKSHYAPFTIVSNDEERYLITNIPLSSPTL
jgi:4-amino-4-deoxy-L-arabinose transferase-like glycosyltransferase